MTVLSERDVRSALDLVYDAASMTGPDPFPHEVLERLARLIPADAIVGYHEAIIGRPCRVVESVEIPEEGIPADIQEAGGRFLDQDPIKHGRGRREVRALKLSDFLTRRERRKLEFYWYVWKPLGIDDSLRVWLPAPAGSARVIYLERGKRDFTERDRSLLELLRPYLIRVQAAAAARRDGEKGAASVLTGREREILGWIARGKTSREIAEILVVSPYTVRKHVEHILEKLEVSTRSAAVARAFPALAPPGGLDPRLGR
jgi:DNA-binding CsgD family transcriptional regulator